MRRRRRENPLSLFSFQDIVTGLCGIMIFMVLVQVVDIAFRTGPVESSVPDQDLTGADRDSLRSEIGKLESELRKIKAQSERSVIAVKDKARPGDAERLKKDLSENELVVAALVSQVHDLETQVELARKADAEDAARIREMERTRRLLEQQMSSMKGRRGVTLIAERGEFKLPVYMICSRAGIEIHRPFEKKPSVRVSALEVQGKLSEFLSELDHTTHSVVLLVRPSGVSCMHTAVEQLRNHSFAYGRDPLEEDLDVVFAVKEGR